MKRASTEFGPGALPSALSSADCRSQMVYCWTWAHAPDRTWGMWRPGTALKLGGLTGRMPYSACENAQSAAMTLWASVRTFWLFRTLTFHRPDGPVAPTSMAS